MDTSANDVALQRALVPHLVQMRHQLRDSCDGVDPEVALIKWLCERNAIKVPEGAVKIVRSQPSNALPSRPPTQDVSHCVAMLGVTPTAKQGTAHGVALPLVTSAKLVMPSPQMHRSQARSPRPSLCEVMSCRDQVESRARSMQEEMRRKLLLQIPVFSSSLTDTEQYDLASKFQHRPFSSRQAVVEQGVCGRDLFLVDRGFCEVRCDTRTGTLAAGTLERGDFFGEVSLLYDRPYSFTVVAKSNVSMLVLSRHDIRMVLGPDYAQRLLPSAHLRIFKTIPMLSTLSVSLLAHVQVLLQRNTWSALCTVVKQGTISSPAQLFILESGQCEQTHEESIVWRFADGRNPLCLCSDMLYPGQHFGIVSAFFGAPEGFNVTAVVTSQTASLSRESLLQLFASGQEGELIKSSIGSRMRCYLLQQVDELKHMDDHLVATLAQHARTVAYSSSDVIFHKGRQPDTIFLLQEGKVLEVNAGAQDYFQPDELFSMDEGPCPRPSSTCHSQPGASFGTACLVDHQATTAASLIADGDCTMVMVPGGVLRAALRRQASCANQRFDILSQII